MSGSPVEWRLDGGIPDNFHISFHEIFTKRRIRHLWVINTPACNRYKWRMVSWGVVSMSSSTSSIELNPSFPSKGILCDSFIRAISVWESFSPGTFLKGWQNVLSESQNRLLVKLASAFDHLGYTLKRGAFLI